MDHLKNNYQGIIRQLQPPTQLLIVSKMRTADEIKYLYELGHRDFGENKVKELIDKSRDLSSLDIRWHFIGNLQTNKIEPLCKLEKLYAIHSVSNLRIVQKLNQIQTSVKTFFQVNTSGENEKSGFKSLEELIFAIDLFEGNIEGLMTIGKIRTSKLELEAKKCFETLISLRDQINSELKLSMGMSSDYPIATKLRSNWVRVGTKVFN